MSVLSGCYVVKYNHKVMPAGKRSLRALLCSLAAVKGFYGPGESAGAAAEKRRKPGRNGRELTVRGDGIWLVMGPWMDKPYMVLAL